MADGEKNAEEFIKEAIEEEERPTKEFNRLMDELDILKAKTQKKVIHYYNSILDEKEIEHQYKIALLERLLPHVEFFGFVDEDEGEGGEYELD